MIERLKTLAAAGAMVAALVAVPTQAAAQSDFDLTLEGGITMPMGDLSDGWDYSGSVGAVGTFWLQEKLGVDLFGAVDMLEGKSVSPNDAYPDLNLFHIGAGISFALTERTEDLGFTVNVGGQYTQMKSDGLGGGVQSPDFSEAYFGGRVGFDVGYMIGSNVSIGIGANLVMTMADEADTGFFSDFRPGGDLTPFSTAMTLPINGVVKIKF